MHFENNDFFLFFVGPSQEEGTFFEWVRRGNKKKRKRKRNRRRKRITKRKISTGKEKKREKKKEKKKKKKERYVKKIGRHLSHTGHTAAT